MNAFAMFAAEVAAQPAGPPIWQPLAIAAVTVGGYLLGIKLWVDRGQGEPPRGSRRRQRRP